MSVKSFVKSVIKSRVLSELSFDISDGMYKGVDTTDLENIVDKIPDKDYKPRIVTMLEQADTSMLFCNTLKTTIDYLSKYESEGYVLRQRFDMNNKVYYTFERPEEETEDMIVESILHDVEEECISLSIKRTGGNA